MHLDLSRPSTCQAGALRRGFTLVELLVVVTIIAVLIAILLPSLRKARDNAKFIHCASGVRQWGMALQYYMHDYSQWLPQEGSSPMSDTEIINNAAWYNALPPYVNAPKYAYVYPGTSFRKNKTFTDPATGYTYTVTGDPRPDAGGFPNSWIWYCQGRMARTKNSTSGLNSFHYAANAVLDGAGTTDTWGGDPGKTHVRATSIAETAATVFLFEFTGNNASDAPANSTAAAYANQVDTARHGDMGSNLLMVDGHAETVRRKQIPMPTRLPDSAGRWLTENPRIIWGPFPATKVN